MARSADFRLDSGFFSHPKIRRLHATHGAQGVLSWVLILAHASQYKTDGRFTGMSDEEIALSAHWAGDAAEFIGVLVELRLLDRRGKTLVLHDWHVHNGYAASYTIRSERSKKAARARWEPKHIDAQRSDEQCGSNAQASRMPKHSSRNALSPSSFPDPNPKKEGAADDEGRTRKPSGDKTSWPWPEGELAPEWWNEKAASLNLDAKTEWELWRTVALSHGDMRYSNWRQASIGRLIREGKKKGDLVAETRTNGVAPSAKPLEQVRKELGLQ